MISELHQMGCTLTENQKLIALFDALLDSWSNLKLILDHSDTLTTFDEYESHLIHQVNK